MNNHTPADQSAATEANAKESSDKPLVIKDEQTTEGDLVIDTPSDRAITVTYTGRWYHHKGTINATGKTHGLSIEDGGVATIAGNTTVHGKDLYGLYLNNLSKLALNGDLVARGDHSGIDLLNAQAEVKGNAVISGNRKASGINPAGLRLGSGSHWSSEGELTADGATVISIEYATFNHHGPITLQGSSNYSGLKMKGGWATINGDITAQEVNYCSLYLTDGAELALNGDLEVKGNEVGVSIEENNQCSIKSQRKIDISSRKDGLFVSDLCHFTSEGPMILQSIENGRALLISGAESFNHQGTLSANSEQIGLSISDTLATITGHTTINSKKNIGIYLSNRGQLILNGSLEDKAGRIGIDIENNSQLTVTEAAIIQAGDETGVKLSKQSNAIFKGPTTIHTKRSEGIDLASGSNWDSSKLLSLESPSSTALKMTQASFTHHGPFIAQGKNGLQLTSSSEATIQGSGSEGSEITSEETALQINASTLRHQGQLQLASQGQGIQLAKAGRAVITGELSIRAKTQPAVALSEEATLDLTQAATTIHCQQPTLPAVTVASASRWRSASALAINTPAEIVLQLDAGHFEHHGPLSLNGEPSLAIEGKMHRKGQGRVLALTNGSRVSLKVDHPLTVNSILLAAEGDEAGSQVTMESPQLSVNGVIDLSHTDGGSLNLKGAGTLQLAELICSPGSRFRVSGDYTVHIGKVSFQLDSVTTQPAQLAFHLSQGNQLQIGQFTLPERQPGSPAPLSLEIEGQGLQVSLDLQKQRAACFPAGTHYTYQAANQAAPIQLIAQLPQGKLEYPSSAQLTQMMASDSCLDPQPTNRFWYTSEGQSCPIAVALDPNSSIIAPTAAQFSNHPPLI